MILLILLSCLFCLSVYYGFGQGANTQETKDLIFDMTKNWTIEDWKNYNDCYYYDVYSNKDLLEELVFK